MRRGQPQCVWTDENDTVRLLAPRSTFADVVQESFRQIRQNAETQPAVLIRLVESLGQLLSQANETQRTVLKEQIGIVLETGRRTIEQKQDLETLEERAKLALKNGPAKKPRRS